MTERERLLRDEPILPLFLKFSMPAIIGMLVQALYNIVDRYYISNIPGSGSVAIGGIGVTLPITFVLMGFTMLYGIGGAANISLRLGEGNHKKAEQILGNVVMLLFVTSFLLNIFFLANVDDLLRLFGATEGNIGFAREYIVWILIGNFWNTFGFAMNHVIRAEGSPKWSMMLMLVGAVTNIILDPIFIYERIPLLNLPGLGMGVKGAAIATIIAQGLAFLLGLSYYVSGKSLLKLRLSNLKPNVGIILMILSIGVSPFFIQIAGSVVGAVFNNSLKVYGGDVAQGAYAIINSIAILFYMPTFGMNQGLQPIIGYNYGAGNFARVKQAVKVGLIAASLVTLSGWIIVLAIPQVLVSTMAREDAVLRQMTQDGLVKVELMMLLVGMQVISSNFFSSIGKARLSFFLSLSRQVFFLIPALLILPRFFGLDGIWYAMPLSDLLATVISLAFLLVQFKLLDEKHAASGKGRSQENKESQKESEIESFDQDQGPKLLETKV